MAPRSALADDISGAGRATDSLGRASEEVPSRVRTRPSLPQVTVEQGRSSTLSGWCSILQIQP